MTELRELKSGPTPELYTKLCIEKIKDGDIINVNDNISIHIIKPTNDILFILSNNSKPGLCSQIVYEYDFKRIRLSNFLYKVDESCKENLGSSPGHHYLDIIFNLIKGLLHCLLLDIKVFYLYDEAYTMNKKLLSILKLLRDGITYYEGYGFIPEFIGDINHNKDEFLSDLEEFLTKRNAFLTTNLEDLTDNIIFFSELKIGDINKKKDVLHSITKLKNTYNAAKSSLSSLYKDERCKEDVYGLLKQIYSLFDDEYVYPITTAENLDAIRKIYERHRLKRHEGFCSYLIRRDSADLHNGGSSIRRSVKTKKNSMRKKRKTMKKQKNKL